MQNKNSFGMWWENGGKRIYTWWEIYLKICQNSVIDLIKEEIWQPLMSFMLL